MQDLAAGERAEFTVGLTACESPPQTFLLALLKIVLAKHWIVRFREEAFTLSVFMRNVFNSETAHCGVGKPQEETISRMALQSHF